MVVAMVVAQERARVRVQVVDSFPLLERRVPASRLLPVDDPPSTLAGA